MKKLFRLLGYVALGLAVVACEKPVDPAESTTVQTARKEEVASTDTRLLVGKWKGKLDTPKSNPEKGSVSNGLEKMAEGMGDAMVSMMNVELEFPTDSTFKMTMMGIPTAGNVTRDGDVLTLNIETIMGMSKEEAAKMSKKPANDKPLKLTVSTDGKKLTSIPEKPDEGVMVFEKSTESAEKTQPVTDKTKSDADRALVGSWTGEFVAPPTTGKETDAEKQNISMMKSLSGKIKLELKKDMTFMLDLMMELNGNWSATEQKLIMNPTGFGGVKMPDGGESKGDPLEAIIANGGSEIILESMSKKEGKVIFRKS